MYNCQFVPLIEQTETTRPHITPLTRQQVGKLAVVIAIGLLVIFAVPRPDSIKPEGWRIFGIFVATIAGLILQPIAGGAMVLLAVTIAAASGGLSMGSALAGYADPSVWLVIAAAFISRALINTGLARRIALFFVRLVGHSSLGVCYALGLTDMVLATLVPSNGARSGGVTLPITRSISELYGSLPGKTANVLGAFLMIGVYESICITTAMFFTGQASNPLAAKMAGDFGVTITPTSWMLAGIVPGLCALFTVPLVVYKIFPPAVKKTPAARTFAAEQLRAMGPLTAAERMVSAVFVGVCVFWVLSDRYHWDVTLIALLGSLALLLSGVITWEDIKAEKWVWDMFIWYGGLVRLGRALNEFNIPQTFAKGVAATFSDLSWVALFALALGLYFYTHYSLASITAHILAMYAPFCAVLIAKGAPPGLVVYAFAIFVNLSAGLTHYGTTPSPMFFAQEYLTMKEWWRVGFVVSVVNLAIWCTIGFGWWKVIGYW